IQRGSAGALPLPIPCDTLQVGRRGAQSLVFTKIQGNRPLREINGVFGIRFFPSGESRHSSFKRECDVALAVGEADLAIVIDDRKRTAITMIQWVRLNSFFLWNRCRL